MPVVRAGQKAGRRAIKKPKPNIWSKSAGWRKKSAGSAEHRAVKKFLIERVVSIVICGDILLHEEPGYYNSYSIRNARSGREFTDVLELNILEPKKLPAEPDGGSLFNWGQFFGAETAEELAMIGESDPAIKEAVAQVMELNENDAERLIAFDRWKWQMDQAALRRQSYREGQEAAEAKYKPALEAKDRENQAIKRENEAKDREIEELRERLREAGIEG
jgi:hypothetical protein